MVRHFTWETEIGKGSGVAFTRDSSVLIYTDGPELKFGRMGKVPTPAKAAVIASAVLGDHDTQRPHELDIPENRPDHVLVVVGCPGALRRKLVELRYTFHKTTGGGATTVVIYRGRKRVAVVRWNWGQ